MGYLSCKAESSISIADSGAASTPSSPSLSSTKSRHHSRSEKKPIKIEEFNYRDLELATNNFSEATLLGRGSHGLVYKGVLRGGRLVAIKRPSRAAAAHRKPIPENPSEFENEIDILSKLQSPRLVNLVGFTNNGGDSSQDRLLVVEFMSNGTLFDVLHSNLRPPNWGRRIKLALQIAKAIDILHSLNPPVIHRDIKSANVLIDRNFNARLGDFGLALRCVDDSRLRSTPPAGTMGYLDPGYVTPDNLSTKTDVFSFGILLLEIISGRKAIDVAYSPPSIVDWAIPLIRKGKLMSVYDPRIVPSKNASALAVVAAKCVRSCRERRPSMKEVVECLSELSRLVPLHSWNGIANPCLMVDTVGKPVQVQSRNVELSSKGVEKGDAMIGTPLSRPRRVHSDLGVRSNLMELMSGPKGESKFLVEDDDESKSVSKKRVSSFRFESGKFVGISSIRSMVLGIDRDPVPSIMGNQ